MQEALHHRLDLGGGGAGDAHGVEIGRAQRLARRLPLGDRHDLAHLTGQRLNFGDRVDRVETQVADHVVEQTQRGRVQRRSGAGTDARKVGAGRIAVGGGVGVQTIGFAQDAQEGVHQLLGGHRVGDLL